MLALMSVATGGRGRAHGRLRRGRRGRRRKHGACRRGEAARARSRATGGLHHPPAAGRVARRAPLPGREAQLARTSLLAPTSSGSTSASSWWSCAGCWAPTPATARPGDMPNGCSRPRRIPATRLRPAEPRADGHIPDTRRRLPAVQRDLRLGCRLSGDPRHRAARQAHQGPGAAARAGRHRDHRPPRHRPDGRRGPGGERGARRWSTSLRRPPGAIPNPGPLILTRGRRAARRRAGRAAVRAAAGRRRSRCAAASVIGPDGLRRRGPGARHRAARARRQRPAAADRRGDRAFAENTLAHIREERELLAGPLKLPDLDDRLPRPPRADRRARHRLQADLRAIRPYIRDLKPVLVGVDGGGDALLEEGLKPDMIIGDMDSASDRVLRMRSGARRARLRRRQRARAREARAARARLQGPARARHEPGRRDAGRVRAGREA